MKVTWVRLELAGDRVEEEVWVHPDFVSAVHEVDDGQVSIRVDGAHYVVKGPIAEVMTALKAGV